MKTRIITAIVGILVLIGVMFTFNTMVFNLVIAAITLIAIHEIYKMCIRDRCRTEQEGL